MARRKVASLIGLFEAAVVVLAIFSISTLFDDLHRYLELFSHFRLQYFVSSLILLLFFSLVRERNFAILALSLSVLNAWTVLPWYLSDDARSHGGNTIKILHANLLASNHDADRFLGLVADEDPDLFIVQEMTPRWLTSLKPLTPSYAYRVLEPEDSPFGIGLFSKIPLDDIRIEKMRPYGFPEIRATVSFDEKTINIDIAYRREPRS